VTSSHGNALLESVRWIEALLLGPLATSIAVIAVASVGLLMLAGRINLRRGATVIAGCFILFGAGGIAHGLRGMTSAGQAQVAVAASPPPPLIEHSAQPRNDQSGQADPYAGAAIRR
jgi:type IV secretory pathway VirB2 component (pilin)